MRELFANEYFLLIVRIYGAFLIIGPILLRIKFRFKAKLNPQLVCVESLPAEVQAFMAPRVKSIAGLGFEQVGYVNLGNMATGTGSFMALFSNPRTSEWADVSVVKSATRMAGYIEFITRCSNDTQVDTNTNSTASVLSPVASHHVFRFPQVKDAFTLYRAHRMLAQQNLRSSKPELPAQGQELAELKRRLERYGPHQQVHGYMFLDKSGEFYRLTWKGAILGTWRSIWPLSILRGWWMQNRGEEKLRALGVAQYRPS